METATYEKLVKEAKSKREMTELVEKVYIATERWIQPTKPFILIRTLPRATVSAGGILLPQKQNKPNIEAVVLAVYEPFWEYAKSKRRGDGHVEDISVLHECDIKVGDHIILPHHVGLPDSFLDEREYRLIKEDDAVAVLHYREKGELRRMVREDILEAIEQSSSAKLVEIALDAVFANYDVVPKVMGCKTTSGK